MNDDLSCNKNRDDGRDAEQEGGFKVDHIFSPAIECAHQTGETYNK